MEENKHKYDLIEEGDLLNCNADIIVQQCNCVTITSMGLSQSIKNKFNIDVYKNRRKFQNKNHCILEDVGIVGSIQIDQVSKDIQDNKIKYIASLFAQFSPSKSSSRYKDLCQHIEDPITLKIITDSHQERILWFERCLKKLELEVVKLKCNQVAFPYKIGCGFAGGNWNQYYNLILAFANRNQISFSTKIIRLKQQ